MPVPRIAPIEAPYDPAIAEIFARVMPAGVEPLKLFRTMARSPRILQRMFAGGLLDKGPVALRDREIVILRTCARCGSEYEWGVHVAMFTKRAGLSEPEIAASIGRDAGPWPARERALIGLVDELHDTAQLSDAGWNALAAHFSSEQVLELIALVGYYHTISFMTNACRVDLESTAARFGQV